ncbi:MAG: nucleotidyltransferase domain-containing protein [Planctomycetes bacterium]|nr:nucleotidyltransferase domain-containing protein [Planctomycetota bacterium]
MVALRDIRSLARCIADEYRPLRIILFGSYAYGKPQRDSDVDLLVVMPYSGNSAHKALEILNRANPRFGVDLLVRSPTELAKRLRMRDGFMQEIIEKGETLYERRHP